MTRRTAAALAGAALACSSTGIPLETLPDEPIAILHHEPEDARQRAEALVRQDGSTPAPRRSSTENRAIMTEDSVSEFLDRFRPSDEEGSIRDRYPGRLAFLDPRTGRVDPVLAARKGAIPSAWSPDRTRLLFAQPVDEKTQMFEFDRSRGVVRPISRGPAVHPKACFGPDGRIVLSQIVFTRGVPSGRILMSEPGGSRPRPISDGPADQDPACAPDGGAVAWVVNRGRSQWISVREPAVGGENRLLTRGRDPAFSPDGQWIVYSAPVKRGWKLYRMRRDGSSRAPVGRGALDEKRPSFSPDGEIVLYLVEQEDRRTKLYLRRIDGTGDRILAFQGDGEFPVW